MTKGIQYDVIIIGGSYAGLSAAMALGRSIRKTLIIDSGEPCNRQTPHAHNFITHDGETPAAITVKAMEQVLAYPTVEFKQGFVTGLAKKKDLFSVATKAGESYSALKIIIATGVKDELPEIPGFAACWGISVLHCPYCHGYEVRQQKTVIMAQGEAAYNMGLMLGNWTSEVVVITNGEHGLDDTQLNLLKAHNVEIVEEEVRALEHEHGRLKSVSFTSGKIIAVEVMYSSVPFVQHSEIASFAGCKLSDSGHIIVDEKQKTNIPGIFAAGDCAASGRAVAIAIADGSKAGMMLNSELIFDQAKK